MKILRALRVKNLVTYREAEIRLDQYPVSVIRGRNHDRQNKKSANAVGKSLLFAALPTLRYARPPSSDDAKSARSLYLDKSGSIELDLASNDSEFRISQYVKGAGTLAYRVAENGVDKGPMKAAIALSEIETAFPLTEDQFYAFVYLDVRNQHVLQRGKPAQRFEFFENIFNLGIYDQIAAEIGKRYSVVRDRIRDLKTYRTEFATRRSQLRMDRRAYDATAQRIAAVQAQMSGAQERLARMYEQQRKFDQFLTLADGLDDDAFRVTVEAATAHLKKLTDDRDELRDLYQGAVRQQEAQRLTAQLRARFQEIRETLRDREIDAMAKPAENLEDAETGAREARAELSRIGRFQPGHWRVLDDFQLSPQMRERLAHTSVETVQGSYDQLRGQRGPQLAAIKNLQAVIAHQATHREARCPHCQQGLSPATAKAALQGLMRNLVALDGRIENTEQCLAYARQLRALPFPTWAECEAQIRVLRHVEDTAAQVIGAWTDYQAAQAERAALVREGESLVQQMRSNADAAETEFSSPTVYQEMGRDVEAQVQELERFLHQRRRLGQYGAAWTPTRVRAERKKLSAQIAGFQPQVTALQSELQNLTMAYAETRAVFSDLVRLNTQIKELEAATADAEALEHLREAFGPKGLRKNRIAALAEMFTMNLNRFASLIYGERITFQTVVGDRSFDILATRNSGKTSDVRFLSGSEDRAFRLLSLLAILPFIPDAYRTNLVVLDEMESGLDAVSKKLFVNEFLPMLNTVIPNIVIITPQSEQEFYVPGAATYLVEKRNGVSTLRLSSAGSTTPVPTKETPPQWSPPSSASPQRTRSNSRISSGATAAPPRRVGGRLPPGPLVGQRRPPGPTFSRSSVSAHL